MRLSSVILSVLMFAAQIVCGGELDVAKAALRDGLWELARRHAEGIASGHGSTHEVDEARRVILESYVGENRWNEASKALSKWTDSKGSAFDYYRAIADGDHAKAMKIISSSGSAEGMIEARMSEASRLAKEGHREEASAIWREVIVSTSACERVVATASVNLGELAMLRRAYESIRSYMWKRKVGLRLGEMLLKNQKTIDEGISVVRAIVKDSPDTDGAKTAFLRIADEQLVSGRVKDAEKTLSEAMEMWPDCTKMASVRDCLGWIAIRLGKKDDALKEFVRAEELAEDDDVRAEEIIKQGDVLSEMGRSEEAMARYRIVQEKFPKTKVAELLKNVISIREAEAKGRELFREYRFADAEGQFAVVAKADPARKDRMSFFKALCLYGRGLDDDAVKIARELTEGAEDETVKAEATKWLAKFLFNRREWRESRKFFETYAQMQVDERAAQDALLWAAYSALSENEYAIAVKITTRLIDLAPTMEIKTRAMLAQSEALIELARFDEAALVLEQIAIAEGISDKDRVRAQMLRADAFFAMGADNSVRYTAALEAYRAIRFGDALTSSDRLVLSYKIARTLEKMKRHDEALDQYYTQVVLAYRDGRLNGERFNEEARAAFSRAAFQMADEYENRGMDRQAVAVLELVVTSDVPAANEAEKRIAKISTKGRFL